MHIIRHRDVQDTTFASATWASLRRLVTVLLGLFGLVGGPPLAAQRPAHPADTPAWEVAFRVGAYADARTSATAACTSGTGAACAALGWYELYGVGGEARPPAVAIARFRAHCPDVPLACAWLGVALSNGIGIPAPARDSAARLFILACDAGEFEGCARREFARSFGYGLPLDAVRARSTLRALCGEDVAVACAFWAEMLQFGRGGPVDLPAAIALNAKWCARGEVRACANEGLLYSRGTGVARDRRIAVARYERACGGGYQSSCANLTAALISYHPAGTDTARALSLAQSACERGAARACYFVATSMTEGWPGVQQDAARALAMFTEQCETFDLSDGCQSAAAMMKARGDRRRAIALNTRGCDLRLALSCFDLANDTWDGRSTPASLSAVAPLWVKSCELGLGAGCMNIANLITKGFWRPRTNPDPAWWRRRACDLGQDEGC